MAAEFVKVCYVGLLISFLEEVMARVISIHSFRGGTGKSNTSANLSAVLASMGKRVGVVDTDIQSPGIHVLFGLTEERVSYSLNDYLWGRCDIEQTACDVTGSLKSPVPGKLYLIPSSINAMDIARVLHDGYDVNLLSNGFRSLISDLDLDALIIDTHPGLNEETLLSIALSNVLIIVLRPDRQDYQGTGITVEVARELGVPEMLLLVNKVPPAFDDSAIRNLVENAYNCEVAAVLPHTDELMNLASEELFVVRYPDSQITREFRKLAMRLLP
jgi:MinD-like ATPase involved in chromosome partitioning or flagellar assembly